MSELVLIIDLICNKELNKIMLYDVSTISVHRRQNQLVVAALYLLDHEFWIIKTVTLLYSSPYCHIHFAL
jgi:hypothetical protein